MKSTSPHDPLSRTLAEWQVSPPANPGFRPGVWQRLAHVRNASWSGHLRAHLAAWCVVALMATAGAGWAGRAAAQAQLDAERERMVFSYLGELDPRVLAQLQH